MAGKTDTWTGWMLGKPVRSTTQRSVLGFGKPCEIHWAGNSTLQSSDCKLGTVEAGIGLFPMVN